MVLDKGFTETFVEHGCLGIVTSLKRNTSNSSLLLSKPLASASPHCVSSDASFEIPNPVHVWDLSKINTFNSLMMKCSTVQETGGRTSYGIQYLPTAEMNERI